MTSESNHLKTAGIPLEYENKVQGVQVVNASCAEVRKYFFPHFIKLINLIILFDLIMQIFRSTKISRFDVVIGS